MKYTDTLIFGDYSSGIYTHFPMPCQQYQSIEDNYNGNIS